MNTNSCDFIFSQDKLFIRMRGEIDHHSAKAIREEIDRELIYYRAKTVILDLTNIEFMDSSGLGLILGRYAKTKALGGSLQISGPNKNAKKILMLAGIDKYIKITDNLKEIRDEDQKNKA